ncbi:MAG: 4Fe-4S dicluster domain-containing protein [Desulfobacteraceae bacterium]|nr:4Fe-4S dicluster domain-containing protein [Desulfobacteraceae bacterium]
MKENSTASSHEPKAMLDGKPVSRREFLSRLAMGGSSLVLLSGCSRWVLPGAGAKEGKKIHAFIAVDYTKCTGCRTCEAVCSAFNNPVPVDGEMIPGPGNPALANIYVHSFNPDVSAPAVCARCVDTPCVNACPVEQDPKTGRRAIFQDEKYGTIINDPDRCISCGNCVAACSADSVGILAQHPETGRPMRMCTLCDGEPECVRHCPYEALSMIRVTDDHLFYRMSPEEIAEKLSARWYDFSA